MTTLSVLICTYNRPEMIERCLQALIERTDEKPDQVVVVNGGDERTDQVVQKYSTIGENLSIAVALVKTVNKNLAVSRNVGLPHCTGDIIAMTDDDAEVSPDWIRQIKMLHAEHTEAGAIGGEVIGVASDSIISSIADQVTFASYPSAREVRTLPGVNVSYKRSVVLAVGPQDETLFRGEDVDYNWRIKQLGKTIWYDPAMKVLHHHRPSMRKFFQQHYMYGRAYYLVRKKHKDMYCVYPHSIRSIGDFAKGCHFFVAAFYEPFIYAFRLRGVFIRLAALPLLFLNQCAWRGGMITEKMREGR